MKSSPFHLQATVRYHTDKYRDKFEKIVDEIQNSTYVDDLLTGEDTVKETYDLISTSRGILRDGGLNLRKFSTNSAELRKIMEAEGLSLGPKSCSELDEGGESAFTDNTQVFFESVKFPEEKEGFWSHLEYRERYFRFSLRCVPYEHLCASETALNCFT